MRVTKYLTEATAREERARVKEVVDILEREKEYISNQITNMGRSGKMTGWDADDKSNYIMARGTIDKILPLVKDLMKYYKLVRWM